METCVAWCIIVSPYERQQAERGRTARTERGGVSQQSKQGGIARQIEQVSTHRTAVSSCLARSGSS